MSAARRIDLRARVEIARACWGDGISEPVLRLAMEADRLGGGLPGEEQAARTIGYSKTVVYEVLRNRYRGRLDRVAAAIRAALMRDVLICPALRREISGAQCLANQSRPYSTASPEAARLYHACRSGCPNATAKEDPK